MDICKVFFHCCLAALWKRKWQCSDRRFARSGMTWPLWRPSHLRAPVIAVRAAIRRTQTCYVNWAFIQSFYLYIFVHIYLFLLELSKKTGLCLISYNQDNHKPPKRGVSQLCCLRLCPKEPLFSHGHTKLCFDNRNFTCIFSAPDPSDPLGSSPRAEGPRMPAFRFSIERIAHSA
jgi:hypothetical protein